jgi:hypothetical protein
MRTRLISRYHVREVALAEGRLEVAAGDKQQDMFPSSLNTGSPDAYQLSVTGVGF